MLPIVARSASGVAQSSAVELDDLPRRLYGGAFVTVSTRSVRWLLLERAGQLEPDHLGDQSHRPEHRRLGLDAPPQPRTPALIIVVCESVRSACGVGQVRSSSTTHSSQVLELTVDDAVSGGPLEVVKTPCPQRKKRKL